MKQPKLTIAQKASRRVARDYGKVAMQSVDRAILDQQRADEWRALARKAQIEEPPNVHHYQYLSDRAIDHAVVSAKIAWHHAQKGIAVDL